MCEKECSCEGKCANCECQQKTDAVVVPGFGTFRRKSFDNMKCYPTLQEAVDSESAKEEK